MNFHVPTINLIHLFLTHIVKYACCVFWNLLKICRCFYWDISLHLIIQVGPTYGRKMMTGLLSSQGIHVSQQRIRNSLCIVSSAYQDARRTATARQTNPVPYHADYFGHKIHVDQNEKLTMFGVTHVAAVDGFSNMIVGFITMPVKNNVEIYANLYW